MLHRFSVRSYDPRNVWFAIFYVTAALATFFVGRDAENTEAELAGAKEVAVLRESLRRRLPQVRPLGWILLWALGIPIPILVVLFLLRGCT